MIGIVAAMPEEIAHIEKSAKIAEKRTFAGREFHLGTLCDREVVIVLARIGKVAAATTTTTLINHFPVSEIVLTGVAGGVHQDVKIGDIVVGNSFIQHDMDASASMRFERFEIPLLGRKELPAAAHLVERATVASHALVNQQYPSAKVHVGLMGAGDQFIASKEKIKELRSTIPSLLCVEMEGAAAAQVCFEYNVPFVSIRSISDNADDEAGTDFLEFVNDHAAPVSRAVIEALLSQ
jgi:adenosylhomocysteine nucleosidase